MRVYRFIAALLVLLLMNNPGLAQQSLPGTIQVEGVAEAIATLQRIESQIQQLMHSRWEYLFVQRNRLEDIEQQIKALGTDGWELVNVTQEEGFILKRRVFSR